MTTFIINEQIAVEAAPAVVAAMRPMMPAVDTYSS